MIPVNLCFCRFWLENGSVVYFVNISFRCFKYNVGLKNQIIQPILCNIFKFLNLDNTKKPESVVTEPITDYSHEKCVFLCMKNPMKIAISL